MGKPIYRLGIGLAVSLTFGVLIWIFTLHGTSGMFHFHVLYRLAFAVFGGSGLLLLGLALAHWGLISKGRTGTARRLVIPVLILTGLGIVIPAGTAAFVSGFPYSAAGDIPPRLVLADNPAHPGVPVMAVMVNTSRPEQLSLSYETIGERSVVLEEKPVTRHIFWLSDLKPDTEYSYSISGGESYRFKTPDILTPKLRFAAAGDAHFGAANNRRDLTLQMAGHIADPANGFNYFFSLGDLVEFGFSNNHWRDALTSLSALSSRVPTGYVPGNHETFLTGLPRYEYFCSPAGAGSASGSPLYYRVSAGKINFLIVNVEWSAESITPGQAAWLEEQLKSIPENEWKIVLSHGYYYSSGSYFGGWHWQDNPETIAALTPLFEKYRVDMVFNGHIHQMELLEHSGVTYITCGGLGGFPEPKKESVSPASLWHSRGGHGFVDVSIEGSEASITFRSPDFQVIHSYNLTRQ